MPYKVLLARIMLEEEKYARIGTGPRETVVDNAGLSFGDLGHPAVELGERVGVLGLAVDLDGSVGMKD